jgi:hypothetical protein
LLTHGTNFSVAQRTLRVKYLLRLFLDTASNGGRPLRILSFHGDKLARTGIAGHSAAEMETAPQA